MKEVKYPGLLAEMAKHGDKQKSLAKLLGKSVPSISKRLLGKKEWSIGEIEKICEHYDKDYYELFKNND